MGLNRLSNTTYWIDERLDINRTDTFEAYVFSRHLQYGILTQDEEKIILERYNKLGYHCMFVEFNELIANKDVVLNDVLVKLKLTTEYVEQSFIDDCLNDSSNYRLFVIKSK
jgi:hypothetical protein